MQDNLCCFVAVAAYATPGKAVYRSGFKAWTRRQSGEPGRSSVCLCMAVGHCAMPRPWNNTIEKLPADTQTRPLAPAIQAQLALDRQEFLPHRPECSQAVHLRSELGGGRFMWSYINLSCL